jgi:hypothetical protein
MGLAQEKSGAERGYEGRLHKAGDLPKPTFTSFRVVLWAAASSV